MQHAVQVEILAVEPPSFDVVPNQTFELTELVARNPLFELSFNQLDKIPLSFESIAHWTVSVERRRLMHSNRDFRIRPID